MCHTVRVNMASASAPALFNDRKSTLVQKHHPYTGNLNSETPGDSNNAFLHWGDVLDVTQTNLSNSMQSKSMWPCGAL